MTVEKRRKYNKTFRGGSDTSLNACVGNNGWVDHETYERGFREAVELIVDGINDDKATLDCAIYPLVFCSRHTIELFLKRQLYFLKKLRNNFEITDKIISSTHDLQLLWKLFKDNASTDRRLLEFISKAEEYILDFAEIDPTGATFRYPYDTSNEKHLSETPIINIEIFIKRFDEFLKLMEDQRCLMESLIDEYATKTYTSELSRFDLFNIAQKLPVRSEWGNEKFIEIKREVMTLYNLSGRKICKALDIIQKNAFLCSEIGMELPLKNLPADKFDVFLSVHKKISQVLREKREQRRQRQEKESNGVNGIGKYIYQPTLDDLKFDDREVEAWKQFKSEVPDETVVLLSALVELGRNNQYFEQLEYYLDKVEADKEAYGIDELGTRLFYNNNTMRLLYNGLKSCGQTSLICLMSSSIN